MRAPGRGLVDNLGVPPSVSVVIPTHNRRALLARTLRSVLWQQEVELEVLIVDDGSTDGTAKWLAGLRDERVTVLREERRMGQSVARNRGIAAAGKEWIAFLDDDDLWAPDKLAAQIACAETSRLEWCYGGALRVDERLQVLEEQRAPQPKRAVELLHEYNAIPATMSNVVTTADATRAAGGFDTHFDQLGDWAFAVTLSRLGPPAHVDRPLVAYLWHGSNLALDVEGLFDELRRFAHALHVTPDNVAFKRYAATLMLRSGRYAQAARLFASAGVESRPARAIRDLVWVGREAIRRNRGRSEEPILSDWAKPAAGWLEGLRATPSEGPEPT